jgi:hypothetical protein
MCYFVNGRNSFAIIGKKVRHVHDALREVRRMVQSGMTDISIRDSAGHIIDGNELLTCVQGKKSLSDDLPAFYVS